MIDDARRAVYKQWNQRPWERVFRGVFLFAEQHMIAGHICDEMRAEGIKFGG